MEFLHYKCDLRLVFLRSSLPWMAETEEGMLTARDLYLIFNLFAIRGSWDRIDIDLRHFYERAYGREPKRGDLHDLSTDLAELSKKLESNPYLRLKWARVSDKSAFGLLQLGSLQKDGDPYVCLTLDEIRDLFNMFPVERGQLEKGLWLFLYIKSHLWGHDYLRKFTDEQGNERVDRVNAYGYWLGMDAIRVASGLNYKTVLAYVGKMTKYGLLSTLPGGINKRTIFVVGNDPQDVAAIREWADHALKDDGNPRQGMPGGHKNFKW